MKHIDNLLLKARRAKGGNISHIIGWCSYEPDRCKFITDVRVWDGVPGSGYQKEYHIESDTPAEAEATFDDIVAQYEKADNIRLFIDDLTYPEAESG